MEWNEFLAGPIIQWAFALVLFFLSPAISKVLAQTSKLLNRLWTEGENRWPEIADLLERGAYKAVWEAERLGVTSGLSLKKDFAVDWLQRYLDGLGYGAIDLHLIEAEIEAAWLENFGMEKIFGEPPVGLEHPPSVSTVPYSE